MFQPNFLIIGAQKAGTTWLHRNLQEHPSVFMPEYEVHFFHKTKNFAKGISWYEKHFHLADNVKVVGESSPDYLWVNHTVDDPEILSKVHLNIHETLPNTKLIVTLRNPVDRAISSINHFVRKEVISPLISIDELLIGNKKNLAERYGVIERGNYYKQLKAYYEYFDREQVLVLIFEEDIIKNPALGLEKICNFLGIDSSFEFTNKNQKINKNTSSKLGLVMRYHLPFTRAFIKTSVDQLLPGPRARAYPSREVIRELYKIYLNENEKLFDLLGYRLTCWHMDID